MSKRTVLFQFHIKCYLCRLWKRFPECLYVHLRRVFLASQILFLNSNWSQYRLNFFNRYTAPKYDTTRIPTQQIDIMILMVVIVGSLCLLLPCGNKYYLHYQKVWKNHYEYQYAVRSLASSRRIFPLSMDHHTQAMQASTKGIPKAT